MSPIPVQFSPATLELDSIALPSTTYRNDGATVVMVMNESGSTILAKMRTRLGVHPHATYHVETTTIATWSERQEFLVPAYEIVATKHNTLRITDTLHPKVSHFHERPFLVIDGGRYANALREKISDPLVKRIANRWLIGSVDQFSDSTDLLNEARSFRWLYE